MPYGIYLSAEGAYVQDQRLQTIANNLANVDTVGFKRELAVFQARYAEAITRGSASPNTGGPNDIGGGVKVYDTQTDFSPGPLKRTNAQSDLAIDGEGFFAVQRDRETLLTRAGNFRVTAEGALVTQQGYPVLSDSGSPVLINPTGGHWEIDATGRIRQEDGSESQLAILRPANLNQMEHAGENLFRSLKGPETVPPDERHVLPGYLESSTVKPTSEMIEMIEASRAMEANLNMVKAQDQMLGGLVSHVLRV